MRYPNIRFMKIGSLGLFFPKRPHNRIFQRPPIFLDSASENMRGISAMVPGLEVGHE